MPLFLDLFAGFLAVFLHMFDEEFGIYKEILCLNAFGQTASLNSYAYLGTPSDHAENGPDSLSRVQLELSMPPSSPVLQEPAHELCVHVPGKRKAWGDAASIIFQACSQHPKYGLEGKLDRYRDKPNDPLVVIPTTYNRLQQPRAVLGDQLATPNSSSTRAPWSRDLVLR